MFKQLMIVFTGEGSSDEAFLGTIIERALNDISLNNGSPFEVSRLVWIGPSKGDATLQVIQNAYKEGANLIVIHRDTDQHSVADTLKNHIHPLLSQTPDELRQLMPIVPLIIRHEQETWLFADLDALDEVLNGRLDRRSLNLPPNIETRANTKELFKRVVKQSGIDHTRGRGLRENDVAERLAETICLAKLARLNSYQQFITDLKAALREIGFIR